MVRHRNKQSKYAKINRMKSFSASQDVISYSTRITPGTAIDGPGIGKVVASGNNKFVKGLGGMTAYVGFFELCKPKRGEKVFVSAACGSIGSLVGQYAKLFGCYVVGCVGSQNKVAFLKDKLGFDDAFNYKEEIDQSSTLRRYFSEGIDIYFDNVGGKMLEAVIDNMNTFGRVAVCGATSEYIDIRKRASLDLVNVIYKRITIQGFLTPDLMIHHFQNFMIKTSNYLRTGELQVTEDISLGIKSIPSAFVGLFNGSNIGKKIVKLVEEEE
ncbi:hypothetical protein Ahy_A09g044924 [Arachis hypogaea]|uniref:Enoyl reductase (ER) domain-containing protein n=1 Tax=Arachis hypogaea TaxID=3818 RepID=A0A445BL53_ARAHY|nr:hypothetical protein Ahy_A09g044924 [Arachis hypogaea]